MNNTRKLLNDNLIYLWKEGEARGVRAGVSWTRHGHGVRGKVAGGALRGEVGSVGARGTRGREDAPRGARRGVHSVGARRTRLLLRRAPAQRRSRLADGALGDARVGVSLSRAGGSVGRGLVEALAELVELRVAVLGALRGALLQRRRQRRIVRAIVEASVAEVGDAREHDGFAIRGGRRARSHHFERVDGHGRRRGHRQRILLG